LGVTAKELRKLLKASGCTFKTGKGHDKVYLGNRQTALPRHGTDIGPYLIHKILKDPGIEKEEK
jgi:predicted RNA binding protein YcfA (HicA-like mRNA interferase family)